MRVPSGHLTYCSNVHPGESWEEVSHAISTAVCAVKARLSPQAPFGVGLRLSARAARELLLGEQLTRFRASLGEQGLYVFTLNGFPYGPFHGQPVKSAVYRPDWREPERGRYTSDLMRILAALLPTGQSGSISTVPGAFKPDLDPSSVASITQQLLGQVLELCELERSTCSEITLALEPEPGCLLETVSETVEFFANQLLAHASRRWLAERAGVSLSEAERLIRRHLGVCLDTCHAAVEFEQPDDTLDVLLKAGLRISKLQLSAGLRLVPNPVTLAALQAYDEPVYLHQVVARTASGDLLRFNDLPAALNSELARAAQEWRVHFHVPIYSNDLGAFTNTQDFLVRILERQRRDALCPALEVETYTWGVLPPEQRQLGLVESVVRELTWVQRQLEQPA
jgi:sugar phosphate isomerase/epimerase